MSYKVGNIGHSVNLEAPFAAVSPGVHGRVLTVLSRTERPMTGRVIADLVRPPASPSGVQRVLGDLVRQGLVNREPAGRAYLYVLNRDHLAASAVVALANLRLELLNRIAATVGDWRPPPAATWMIGSVARGESGSDSDLDLLLVRPAVVPSSDEAWDANLTGLASAVRAWTDNSCEVIDYSVRELQAMDDRGDWLLAEVRRGAIAITGPLPRELVPGAHP